MCELVHSHTLNCCMALWPNMKSTPCVFSKHRQSWKQLPIYSPKQPVINHQPFLCNPIILVMYRACKKKSSWTLTPLHCADGSSNISQLQRVWILVKPCIKLQLRLGCNHFPSARAFIWQHKAQHAGETKHMVITLRYLSCWSHMWFSPMTQFQSTWLCGKSPQWQFTWVGFQPKVLAQHVPFLSISSKLAFEQLVSHQNCVVGCTGIVATAPADCANNVKMRLLVPLSPKLEHKYTQ